MNEIAVPIIITASIILACRVWYHEGYVAALKDVRKMLKDNRKVGTEVPCSEDGKEEGCEH